VSYFDLKFRVDFLGPVKNVKINILFFTVYGVIEIVILNIKRIWRFENSRGEIWQSGTSIIKHYNFLLKVAERKIRFIFRFTASARIPH